MKKQLIALLACGAISAGATLGLTGCGGGDNTLTVWAPQTQQTLVQKLVNDFLAENPDFGLEVKVGICGEDNAYARMSTALQTTSL